MPSTDDVSAYCLLLPKLAGTGLPTPEHTPLYMAINSEWEDITPNGTFAAPKLHI